MSNADDLTFLNTLLGEGEVSVRIQHADGRVSETQESIFCGIWRVRSQNNKGRRQEHLEAGSASRALWQAATTNTLPGDNLPSPPIDGLMNGLTPAQELLAHVHDPTAQPHSINLTQLSISDADRLFLVHLCGEGHIQIRTTGYGESQVDVTALRHVWHVRCLDTPKGLLLESYEICPLPELVSAASKDLLDSLERLGKVCGWLRSGSPV